MARGIFPQLNVKEVTDALAGWGFSVSPEQLHRPTPDFVESVYCACLQQATNLNHDTLRDPVHNALNASQVEDEVCCWSYSMSSNLLKTLNRICTHPL